MKEGKCSEGSRNVKSEVGVIDELDVVYIEKVNIVIDEGREGLEWWPAERQRVGAYVKRISNKIPSSLCKKRMKDVGWDRMREKTFKEKKK